MGLLHYAVLIAILAFLFHYATDMLYSKHPLHFDGEVDSEYESVRKAFQQNFINGWESEGAAVAVFVNGRKVVDIWGGYADKQAARTWKKDTITVVFSTTKAVAAMCIALLADRGKLRYDDPIAKYWPEFAKNGKENITIEWVMSHMAGLPYFDTTITKEMALNHDLMRETIENEAPKYPPGIRSGYHALTYGWLVDQIVRHTDERKRGIGQFLREEITERNGIDFHIGLSSSEEYRVARITPPTISSMLGEIMHDFHIAKMLLDFHMTNKGKLKRVFGNPTWIDLTSLNNPEQHAMEQAAVLGVGNARSLASLFNLLINGRLVSEKTLNILKKPVISGEDYVIGINLIKGHGFLYHPSMTKKSELLIGHEGYGAQHLIVDLKNKVVIAYVTNGIKIGAYDQSRTYAPLQKAVYNVIERT